MESSSKIAIGFSFLVLFLVGFTLGHILGKSEQNSPLETKSAISSDK